MADVSECGSLVVCKAPRHTLRKQDFPVVRSHRESVCVSNKFGLVRREMFQDQGGEVPVLSQMQEVLHVQRVDSVLLVFVDDLL